LRLVPTGKGGLVGSLAKGDLMGIVNRRNAVLGWGVWKVAKKFGKRKARTAVPGTGGHAGLNKGAIASVLTAAGGALWFWRKKSDKTTPGS
jgi:ABC-type Co2+ transport system permease subunit